MILHVLVFRRFLARLELVRHRLSGVEVVNVCLKYDVLLALACERRWGALVLLVDLVQVDHLLVGRRVHQGLVRKGIQLRVTSARYEGAVVELLPLGLHDVDELVASEALRVRACLLVSLVDLVGCGGVQARGVAGLLTALAVLGRG